MRWYPALPVLSPILSGFGMDGSEFWTGARSCLLDVEWSSQMGDALREKLSISTRSTNAGGGGNLLSFPPSSSSWFPPALASLASSHPPPKAPPSSRRAS